MKSECGRDGCDEMHHPLLHEEAETTRQAVVSQEHCFTHCGSSDGILFQYVPVVLYGSNKTIRTVAFIDNGSYSTFVDHSLVDELKVEGAPFA